MLIFPVQINLIVRLTNHHANGILKYGMTNAGNQYMNQYR